MADREFDVSVVLGVVDNATQQMTGINSKFEESFATLKSTGIAMAASLAAIGAGVLEIAKAAGDEQFAMEKLRTSVELTGASWTDSKDKVDEYINSMVNATIRSDDELIPALQKMTLYTGDIDQAMTQVKIAVDFAASGFVDLDTAIRLVGMAGEGNITMLGRYIPELKNLDTQTLGLKDSTDKAKYALDLLAEKFGGMAGAEVATFNGAMANLKKAFDDFIESVGTPLLAPLTNFMNYITNTIRSTDDWLKKNDELVMNIGTLTAALGTLALAIQGVLNPYGALAIAVGLTADNITRQMLASQEAEQANMNLNKSAQDLKQTYYDEIAAIAARMAKLKVDSDEYKALEAELVTYKRAISYQKLKIEEDEAQKIATARYMASVGDIDLQKKVSNTIIGLKESEKEAGIYFAKTGLEIQQALWEGYSMSAIGVIEGIINLMKGIAPTVEFMTGEVNKIYTSFYELQKINIDNWRDDQLKAEFDVYNSEKNRIETTVADETAKAQQLAILDRDYANKKVNIENDAREKQKKAKEEMKGWAIAEAIISGALAVLKTLAQYGLTPIGIAAAAAQTIQTGLQIAIINAQRFAKGVRHFVGGMAVVGEEGAELVRLPTGADVFTNQESRQMIAGAGAGAGGINITIDISGNYLLNEGSAQGLADTISNIILKRVRKERLI